MDAICALLCEEFQVDPSELMLWLCMMVLFLLINAFFVAAEFALVAIRKSRIQEMEEQGHPKAGAVSKLKTDIDYSVSGAQLGITLASLALGWVGEHSIHELVKMGLGLIPGLAGVEPPVGIGFAFSFLILSGLHVIIGEQVPKILALRTPEKLLLWLVTPFRIYCKVAYPLIWVMNGISDFILKLMGVPKSEGGEHAVHSAEELGILIEASGEAGELDTREADLLKRVLDMRELSVQNVMVPRSRMDSISDHLTLPQLLGVVARTKHSKLPVFGKSTQKIVGILNSRDLFDIWAASAKHVDENECELFDMEKIMRPAFFARNDMAASALLDELRNRKIQMAIVVDETDECVGLITMEDLLEQLVGEIYDEYDKQTKNPRK